jgi:TetR/AcrR family transcriptional regulator, regulator of cefoperazone and chloramphenicol sensitivity
MDARAPKQTQARGETAAKTAGRSASSPHYRRARRDRGAETRQRLIEAALDVFGRFGFEGASTRLIAKEAGANLAAIVYHFGSKEALHSAVAEYIVGRITGLVGPALAGVIGPEAAATPERARASMIGLLEAYTDILLGEAEAELWARFIIREQMRPTAAFEVIFKYMGGMHGVGSRLVAAALGKKEDRETALKTFTLMGQILVFRVAQAMVLRRIGWTQIGAKERGEIKRIVAAQTNAILGGGGP